MAKLEILQGLVLNIFGFMNSEESEGDLYYEEQWHSPCCNDGICRNGQKRDYSKKIKNDKRKFIVIYLKLFFLLLISGTLGWYASDVMGYPRAGIIIFILIASILLFPFGFLKISFTKQENL